MVQSLPGIDEIDREETRLYVEHNFSAQVIAEKYTRVYKKVRYRHNAASHHTGFAVRKLEKSVAGDRCISPGETGTSFCAGSACGGHGSG